VKTKKAKASDDRPKSQGTIMMEKYRPSMSRLTGAERQKLMMRGLQMIAQLSNIPHGFSHR